MAEIIFMTTKKEEQRTLDGILQEAVQRENISYMEAVLDYCEKHLIEPEMIVKKLSKPIKEKIEAEASKLNLLKIKYENIV